MRAIFNTQVQVLARAGLKSTPVYSPSVKRGGGVVDGVEEAIGAEGVARIFIAFPTKVVRDGIDSQFAHKAFLQIEEYGRAISPDIEGAEPSD